MGAHRKTLKSCNPGGWVRTIDFQINPSGTLPTELRWDAHTEQERQYETCSVWVVVSEAEYSRDRPPLARVTGEYNPLRYRLD